MAGVYSEGQCLPTVVTSSVQVLYLQTSGQFMTMSKGGTAVLWDGEDMSPLHTQQLQNSRVAPKDLWVTDAVLLPNINKVTSSA